MCHIHHVVRGIAKNSHTELLWCRKRQQLHGQIWFGGNGTQPKASLVLPSILSFVIVLVTFFAYAQGEMVWSCFDYVFIVFLEGDSFM